MKKSLADLNKIKDEMKNKIAARGDTEDNTRMVVGMATCGIAAGARPVLMTLTELVTEKKLEKVTVMQTGCIGICQYEPIVEVYEPGKEKVTYVKVTPDIAKEIIDRHIVGGMVAAEYTIGEMTK